MAKYFTYFIAILIISLPLQAMDVEKIDEPHAAQAAHLPLAPQEHHSEEALKQKADEIYRELFQVSDIDSRVQSLEDTIRKLSKSYSEEDSRKILSNLTNTLIANKGGATKGLTSLAKGTTSHHLILAHYVYDVMKQLNLNLDDKCTTWVAKPYGLGRKTISCAEYLQQAPINDPEKHQNNLLSVVNETKRQYESQKVHGIIPDESDFTHLEVHADVPESGKLLPHVDVILAEGIDGIKKLGMFYGVLALNQATELQKHIQTLPIADPQRAEFEAKLLQYDAVLQRYRTEIQNYKAINPDHIKITADGTAMVMGEGKEISIVFGGMGVGPGGMEEGQALAYMYNNPPLKFQQGLGGAHEGFFIRLSKSWDEIYTFCLTYSASMGLTVKDMNYKIIGHSMGGGVAPIAALRLALLTFNGNPENHIKVITFGAPRSLDATLGASYNVLLQNKTFMFVHDGDSNVPNQPPNAIGYIHVGKRITIPQPNVSADPTKNRKVFHQYAGYKNVLDHCESELRDRHLVCARVESEESKTVYALQTAKNLVLAPFRAVAGFFGSDNALIENHNPYLVNKINP